MSQTIKEPFQILNDSNHTVLNNTDHDPTAVKLQSKGDKVEVQNNNMGRFRTAVWKNITAKGEIVHWFKRNGDSRTSKGEIVHWFKRKGDSIAKFSALHSIMITYFLLSY